MSTQSSYKELIVGWIKSQLGFHGDPIRSRRERDQAAEIEQELHDRARDDASRAVFETVMPARWKRAIGDLERHADEQRSAAERRAREEQEALPRGLVSLTFSGVLNGETMPTLPLKVTWPETTNEALIVEMMPLEPIAFADRVFRGLQLAVPRYSGNGRYDLSALYVQYEDDWDPYWFQLWLESDDEPFYWVPDYGPATIEITGTGQTLRAHLPMQNAGSERLIVDLSVTLPPRGVSPS